MKVLHINSYYSGSSFYKNLYDKQTKLEMDIDVFVPVPMSYVSSSKSMGEYTMISANHQKHDRFLYSLKHNKIYKDILQKYRIKDYSILHAHSLFSNGYIAMKLKRKFGIPYVVAVRNTDVYTFFKYMIHLRKIGVQILKEASKIIFLSESYKKMTIENYVPDIFKNEILNKSKVIPNGIDDFWFRNKGVPKQVTLKEINLLYIGAINKNKNILSTVRAIEVLKKRCINVSLTIVGKIEDESVYKKIANHSNISYLKPRKKEELLDLYRSSDIFVMPSIHETFGLVYAEAMSQGLPVIYSKDQGFDGQFKEGTVGFHVNSINEEEIADRIYDIMVDYNILSVNSIRKVDKFNWDNITSNYKEVYLEIIARE